MNKNIPPRPYLPDDWCCPYCGGKGIHYGFRDAWECSHCGAVLAQPKAQERSIRISDEQKGDCVIEVTADIHKFGIAMLELNDVFNSVSLTIGDALVPAMAELGRAMAENIDADLSQV